LLLLSRTAPAPAGGTPPTQVVEALPPSDAMQTVLDDVQAAANGQSALLGGAATALYQSRDGDPTLTIQVCRPADTDLFAAMDYAMDLAADYSTTVSEELAAVGADLINCIRQDTLLSAVAPIEAAQAYADGDLSSQEYRSTWQWLP
ncbi:MAG: hypothetical protein JW910_16605, partial [Anaerolineae bacterium]|nr:hypothetical protein [Anaerolineae bacterium]